MNDPAVIARGFYLERDINLINVQFSQIMENQPPGTDIKDVIKDSDSRFGMTGPSFGTGDNDMTTVLPPLHAILNIGSHMAETGYYQNARHAFPNNIPFRGNGKSEGAKAALVVSTKAFNLKASQRPLGLPVGQLDAGVGFCSITSYCLKLILT